MQFGYGLNYLIDTGSAAVILDVEATPARTYDEVAATKPMFERTETTFGVKPNWLAGDTAYGVGRLLALLWRRVLRRIFRFGTSANAMTVRSPAATLRSSKIATDTFVRRAASEDNGPHLSGCVLRYTASTYDCGPCPLKPKCCPNTPQRIVPRDVNENARDHARALVGTPEFEKSRDARKKVEMRFAHLKVHHHFERMRLRGLTGARDEFQLAATVQNLKTIASYLWRPPPNHLVHSPA